MDGSIPLPSFSEGKCQNKKKKIGKKTPTNYREQERVIKVMEQLPHKKKLNKSDPGLENGTAMII